MSDVTPPKGPASYFPSIEKTYGKPIAHWLQILDGLAHLKHMEQVAHLKAEHQMGHGHANALVAHHRARSGG
ncbi:DUF4287 domain-containing protein [Sphaerotilus mobilis]|uniref:Uncharacterized protein DUF4287 n=1 Tax=Sphaerotilus mobilis TaxID=47994 RepID=A0A4Q7L995_9BURK|nr:DUF4287 domain-containing protein [Sphaerotilus mobilis]RZS46637.1 uncharacterized protein DUF4287 [Sphaerotilus mobilis]